MNYHNDDDRETSIWCRNIISGMLVDGMESEFMAGTYICAGDDGRSAELNEFLGIKILELNLLLAVTNR